MVSVFRTTSVSNEIQFSLRNKDPVTETNTLLTGSEAESDALLYRHLALCQRQTVLQPKSSGKLSHVCMPAESCSVAAESSIRAKQS